MGAGRWDSSTWDTFTATKTAGKPVAAIFSSGLKDELDPAKITMRESRDSADNPNSTPIILACDVTGSMGMVAEEIVRHSLNTLVKEIYDRKPVPDPHVMIMAVGDAYCDRAPLQATQFEADIRIAEALTNIFLEGGGGGNAGESYALAHAFAAYKTSTDCHEKHGRKGFLFTMGDEPILDKVTADQMRKFLNIPAQADMTSADLIARARESYEVYHIVFKNVGAAVYDLNHVMSTWNAVLPERVIQLSDHKSLVETIVSLLQLHAGEHLDAVANSWSGSKSLIIRDALSSLPVRKDDTGGSGIVRL